MHAKAAGNQQKKLLQNDNQTAASDRVLQEKSISSTCSMKQSLSALYESGQQNAKAIPHV